MSGLLTGTVSEGTEQVAGGRFFLEHVYFEDDVLEWNWMARNRHPVALLSEATEGNLERCLHWRELLGPAGFGHEARGVFTVSQELWGAICALRERGRPDFSPREVALRCRIAPHVGAGLKAAAFRSQASPEDNGDGAPGVLVLDQRGWILHYTAAAERWLRDLGDLGPGWREGDGLPVAMWSAVGTLRRALKPQTERDRASVPRVCVRARSGRWLTLNASMSESQHLGSPGEIVIVIEPAGFKEMAWLHTAAFGLSPREEEVVEFVVRGASTRQISQALYVTEDTIQKHSQNVFEKVGVRSRQALVKRSISIPFFRSPSINAAREVFVAGVARPVLRRSCGSRLHCYWLPRLPRCPPSSGRGSEPLPAYTTRYPTKLVCSGASPTWRILASCIEVASG